MNNLLSAWKEFKRGKMNKADVLDFEFSLEDNLWQLHDELKNKTYAHSQYIPFYITDPKLRHIHKAVIKDRLLHQAVFRVLYPIFDQSFIFDSYSCRLAKGTHRAVKKLVSFSKKESQNYTRTIYCLKCDVKRFFNSIDQPILFSLIEKKIADQDALWLVQKIIGSFIGESNQGLPLGNVTSQLFANIYLNEFDQFIKHDLKVQYYLRYCDDFIIIHQNREYLAKLIPVIEEFLKDRLKLTLHPKKIFIRKLRQGFDFLGYIVLPHHIVLRTKTKRRMFKKLFEKRKMFLNGLISETSFDQSLQSYLGMLRHCRGYKIERKIKESFGLT